MVHLKRDSRTVHSDVHVNVLMAAKESKKMTVRATATAFVQTIRLILLISTENVHVSVSVKTVQCRIRRQVDAIVLMMKKRAIM